MNTAEILQQIDEEISRLTQARDLFSGRVTTGVARTSRTARPAVAKSRPGRSKRTISPEGRARIAAAQKRRWEKQKAAKRG